MYNVFVRFKGERFCQWPVMQDRRNRRDYYFGQIGERYPASFTKATLGNAVAFALSLNEVAQVEIKQEIDHDQEPDESYSSGCEASYLMCS